VYQPAKEIIGSLENIKGRVEGKPKIVENKLEKIK
jgi:hypothetical protein